MKRRFAFCVGDNHKLLEVNDNLFKGYICYLKFNNITNPLIVNNSKYDICIKDNNYEWYLVYPVNGKYALTIMYDDVTILPKLMKLHQYGLEKISFDEAIKLSELESMEKVTS